MFGLQEIHVARRQGHRSPVEPAIQHKRPAGIARALIEIREFLFQALVLNRRQYTAIRSRVDERTGRARGVVEKRLVPAGRRVMRVDGDSCGFLLALTVVIVERIEKREVQDRRRGGILVEAHRGSRG